MKQVHHHFPRHGYSSLLVSDLRDGNNNSKTNFLVWHLKKLFCTIGLKTFVVLDLQ